jgi:hypothetical protein
MRRQSVTPTWQQKHWLVGSGAVLRGGVVVNNGFKPLHWLQRLLCGSSTPDTRSDALVAAWVCSVVPEQAVGLADAATCSGSRSTCRTLVTGMQLPMRHTHARCGSDRAASRHGHRRQARTRSQKRERNGMRRPVLMRMSLRPSVQLHGVSTPLSSTNVAGSGLPCTHTCRSLHASNDAAVKAEGGGPHVTPACSKCGGPCVARLLAPLPPQPPRDQQQTCPNSSPAIV